MDILDGIKRGGDDPDEQHFHLLTLTVNTLEKSSLILKMLSANLLVVFLFVASVKASLNLHGQPLFTGVTEYAFEVVNSTLTKPTPCYTTLGKVSQCRKKRGMEEQPEIQSEGLEIAPSAVLSVEATPAPRSPRFNANDFKNFVITSSIQDSFANSMNNLFRQQAAKGRDNVISVGDCGMSTVNFSQFLSCLGLTVQQTTTLTATFTETHTLSSGYNRMTVSGCTPAGFSYPYCPSDTQVRGSRTADKPQQPTRRRVAIVKRPVV